MKRVGLVSITKKGTLAEGLVVGNENSWAAFYPEAARNFDESSLEVSHLAEVVGVASRKFGTRPAVSTQLPTGACTTLNYNDIDRLTSDFAVYLREVAGVQVGDVVALMSPNCIDFLLAVFGSFKAGCICTNINPLYTAPEMEHQLRDSGAKVLIIVDLFGDKADATVANTSVRLVIKISLLDFFPPLKKVIMGFVLRKIKKVIPAMSISHISMADALKQGAARRSSSSINVDQYRTGQSINEPALYQYTGGTTGRSKGAELTHRNILVNAALAISMIVDEVEPRDGDCVLVALPVYHITAFVLIMLPCLQNGSHGIMIPSPRPPGNLKPAFENHTITHFSGINALFAALLTEPWFTRKVSRHLRFCGSGGAAQRDDVAERWEQLTGLQIHQGYGLTEAAGVLTVNPIGANRQGSTGVPIPATVVKVVDSQGIELAAGEAGEVLARGPSIMQGYLNQPEATEETIEDGWLHTGDIGVMDEDGYLSIVDRKKDMILVSGFNVYPNEIEEVIARLDGVSEVGVIGVPDEKTGESVKAFIVSTDPNLTAEQVITHCEGSLTNYKRPKHVEFTEEIPMTPVGKVLRRNLRQMHSE
jgi:long-chain acyl-CoA synthetase